MEGTIENKTLRKQITNLSHWPDLKVSIDVSKLQNLHLSLSQLLMFDFVPFVSSLGTDADFRVVGLLWLEHGPHDPSILGVDQFETIDARQISLGLPLQTFLVAQLVFQPHSTLVHDVGSLPVVFLGDVE